MNKPKIFLNKLNLFWIIVLLSQFLNNAVVLSQEVIATGGDFNKNNQGSISYTIGEPVVETIKGTSGSLTQGFNQPLILVTPINEPTGLNYEINVFPNPAQDFIRVKINMDYLSNLQYILFDEAGHIVQQNNIFQNETDIFLNDLPSAHYILSIFDNQKDIKSFQIVKSQKP
jgi:hypothetical protein